MIQKEVLHGGRDGKISKEEDKVIRPGNKWTSHVQSFLSFMHENGFNNIPKPYGISESGMEMVSFVDGTVYNDSLPKEILTDDILIQVAKLLRRYHDIGEKYVERLTGEEVGMLHIDDIDFSERECVVYGKGDKERKAYFDAKTKIHLINYIESRTDNNSALFVSLNKPHSRLTESGVELRGMPIEQVQKILGHEQIDTTLRYAMVNLIENIFLSE